MAPDWARLQLLFDEASALPASDMDAYLERECAGNPELHKMVNDLLAEAKGGASGFLRNIVANDSEDLAASQENPSPRKDRIGERVGPYVIEKEIGRGGMGDVYLARRADQAYEQRIALKIVRQGIAIEEVLGRFRLERQILARLEHPNIVRLLDGGSTCDGLPYLVMDYVEGVAITTYCEARNLDDKGKCALMLQVCDAVSHAHRNLIVHRDLKPANILVTAEGTPKLLDFGIAKLLEADSGEHTVTEFRPLTPDYASPEQLSGAPITTATDVYQLGAVLSRLLTGQKPGSTHRRAAGNDLDVIVRRAMHQEPDRRYSSAPQLADDLRRYLENRPILAQADSFAYRVSKWVRRSPLLAGALAIAFISTVAGVSATVYQARIAERRFEQVRKLAGAFVFQIDDKIRDLQGSTGARLFVVETAIQYLDSLEKDAGRDSSLLSEIASAYLSIGSIQGNPTGSNLGQTEQALKSFAKSIDLSRKVLEKEPANLTALRALTSGLYYSGIISGSARREREKALMTLREALGYSERMLALDGKGAKLSDQDLAAVSTANAYYADLLSKTKPKESIPYFEKAIETSSRISVRSSAIVTAGLAPRIGLSRVQRDLGNSVEWARRLEEALAIIEPVYRANPKSNATRRQLWLILRELGDSHGDPKQFHLNQRRKAVDYLTRAEALVNTSEAADFGALSEQSFTQISLAGALLWLDAEASIQHAKVGLAATAEMQKRDAKSVVAQHLTHTLEMQLALSYHRAGRASLALPLAQKLNTYNGGVLAKDPNDLGALDNLVRGDVLLGEIYLSLSRWDDARRVLTNAEAASAKTVNQYRDDLFFLRNHSSALEALGDYHALHGSSSESRAHYKKALDIWRKWTEIAPPGPYPQLHIAAIQKKLNKPPAGNLVSDLMTR